MPSLPRVLTSKIKLSHGHEHFYATKKHQEELPSLSFVCAEAALLGKCGLVPPSSDYPERAECAFWREMRKMNLKAEYTWT